jgi:UDP-N-acetylmuramoyl-L-alanyl-D-glutamate--2,6-diaminopimelate ligase
VHPAIARLDQLGIKRTRLIADSRELREGDVFAAYPGTSADGRQFLAQAAKAGAAAILVQSGSGCAASLDIPVVMVENLSRIIGSVADDFYDRPSSSLSVHGVTGTNGKTTIATWLAQANNALGRNCGFIGTVGTGFLGQLRDSKNTTPDAASIHGELAALKQRGATAVAMEVSSHALDQARVGGVRFDCAIFSNLTQDHLDYHKTMAAYGEAKAKLFTDYPVRHRIVNVDDEFGARLFARRLPNAVSYGVQSGLVRCTISHTASDHMQLVIDSPWGRVSERVAAAGAFNAYNATAVAAALFATGAGRDDVAFALSALIPAAGRLQRVASDRTSMPSVFVDYAHTPDALSKAIAALREVCTGQLWVVFGCGGDRDITKRPLMGEIAARHADHVVITSDNPRSESPDAIIEAIRIGAVRVASSRVIAMVDRGEAIAYAINSAAARDIVLIAGKGHETYQEISGVRYAFSDIDVAQAIVQASSEVSHAAH